MEETHDTLITKIETSVHIHLHAEACANKAKVIHIIQKQPEQLLITGHAMYIHVQYVSIRIIMMMIVGCTQ